MYPIKVVMLCIVPNFLCIALAGDNDKVNRHVDLKPRQNFAGNASAPTYTTTTTTTTTTTATDFITITSTETPIQGCGTTSVVTTLSLSGNTTVTVQPPTPAVAATTITTTDAEGVDTTITTTTTNSASGIIDADLADGPHMLVPTSPVEGTASGIVINSVFLTMLATVTWGAIFML